MSGQEETQPIRVVDSQRDEWWDLRWIEPPHGADVVLTLIAPDGRDWSAEGWNIFDAFTNLRRQLDPLGLKLCCQGARTQTGISGMTMDMGQGLVVYRIEHGKPASRRDLVGIFDPAPPSEIGTVEDQAEYREQWLEKSSFPGRPRDRATDVRYQSPLSPWLARLSAGPGRWWRRFTSRR